MAKEAMLNVFSFGLEMCPVTAASEPSSISKLMAR